MTFSQMAGIVPALIFPIATLLQLVRVLQSRAAAAAASPATWSLFGIANVAIYIYAERYSEWQAIVGMLLTAVLDFAVAAVALVATTKLFPQLRSES
jgi:uncharacterized protein with PQ loop repeat